VNHTTQVILAVLVAAALVAGMFATGIQPTQAGGGRHKYKGSGDSVAFEQENKQKAKCLALVISRADACNQEARNNFNVNPGEEEVPIAVGCPSNTVFDAHLSEALGQFPSGSEVCLQKPGENPDSSIVPQGSTTATPQSVRADQSDAGQCSEGSRALVDTGNPPGGPNSAFALGQTICITLT
jgi:hypothetical protein